jgi:ferric-dicitrate binding protein FerR (iron transport regulator)
VLGTSFNVEAYPDDGKTQVAVAEGEVALRSNAGSKMSRDSAAASTEVQLRSQSLGIATQQGLHAVRRGVDLSGRLAWTEGRLVFEDASLEEVARRLERWYGLQVEVQVSPDNVVGLNATFKDESLSEVLQSIAVALELKYERERDTVTFFR